MWASQGGHLQVCELLLKVPSGGEGGSDYSVFLFSYIHIYILYIYICMYIYICIYIYVYIYIYTCIYIYIYTHDMLIHLLNVFV